MNFETISSGSHGNAYLLESEGSTLLIEAGLPFKKLQQEFFKRGKSMTKLSACLISHGHGDHAKAAQTVNAMGIRTVMSASCADQLCTGLEWPFLYICKPLRTLPFEPFRVTAFAMKHDVDNGSYGFVVDIVDHETGVLRDRLCYISDARFTEYRVGGVTIWAVEANYDPEILRRNVAKGSLDPFVAKRVIESHMSIETTIALLKANDLSRCEKIVLLHLSDGNSDAADFIRRVEAATGVPTEVAGWSPL